MNLTNDVLIKSPFDTNNMIPTDAPIVEISRLNPVSLIISFIVMVGLHTLIGVTLNKTKKEFEKLTPIDGRRTELASKIKTLELLFRWYPVGAVIVVLLVLLF